MRSDRICELQNLFLGGLGDVIDDGAILPASRSQHDDYAAIHLLRVSYLVQVIVGAAVRALEVARAAVFVELGVRTKGSLLAAEKAGGFPAVHDRHRGRRFPIGDGDSTGIVYRTCEALLEQVVSMATEEG